jgi:cytochrome c5
MRMRGSTAIIIGLAAAVNLACSNDAAAPAATADDVERATAVIPGDARLADLYRQSCRACHTIAGSGAPLTGHREAWDVRWKKGADALRSNTIRGLNGMPAGGQCFACTVQDYDALIRFMAGRTG